ncbi:MAG: hypothetical protein K2L77_03285 [Muribaculaceae bacterium]|nr:hypothetical protein [Muribaculaceae bacterium]
MKNVYAFAIVALFSTGIAASAAPVMKSLKKTASLSAPVSLPATDITDEGFTANWKAYPGAETYTVLVYEPTVVSAAGEYSILEESFNLVSKGSMVEPYFPDEALVSISDLDWTYTPDWTGFYPVFARGMVSGIVYSPYLDLVHAGGKFTVTMGVTGYSGATVKLTSNGSTEETKEFVLETSGYNEFTATFTNGTHDTYLTFVDFGILDDPDNLYSNCFDYLDDIVVSQHLEAGETALRIIDCKEVSGTSHQFATLPFRYGATRLAYDVQANIVTFNDPDDPYDYDVEWTPYSELQYVTLGTQGITAPTAAEAAVPQYYTIQGVYVGSEATTPGMYIVRRGNKTSKEIVK